MEAIPAVGEEISPIGCFTKEVDRVQSTYALPHLLKFLQLVTWCKSRITGHSGHVCREVTPIRNEERSAIHIGGLEEEIKESGTVCRCLLLLFPAAVPE